MTVFDSFSVIDDGFEQLILAHAVKKESDRAEAIRYAVSIAKDGDVFLLAGKGHEDYQLILGEKLPFSERKLLEEAASALTTS